MTDAIPTVVVARRVKQGRESDFRLWNERLRIAAEQFPGHLGSEAQPPSDAHPGEWINIYRFDSQETLDGWLGSEERAGLMREGIDLVDGPTREQRIAQRDFQSDVVTAVMSVRIHPQAFDEYRRAHVAIAQAMGRFPGFVRCELVEPDPGVQDDHVIVFSFDSRANLDNWLESSAREQVLRRIEPLIEGERTLNVVGGFGGWFAPEREHAPVRWKQAIAVLIALYPMTLTIGFIQRAVAPDVPFVPALFVSNVLGIAALTWLLMPVVTRVLDPWLRR